MNWVFDAATHEAATLAPWGFRGVDSQGRTHRHVPDAGRGEYQRDCDRIIHCRAFRRLQYKTQVFTSDEGDHFRSRLTHTLEVANLARAAARRLGLNQDLVEAVALVHDLGHPPFGHRGEDMLATLMAEHGGFEHNRQALRLVEELEVRYPEFPGLNLTFEVRESIMKHSAHHDRSKIPLRFQPDAAPLLEAQLVDEIDSVVYDCHDVDDGLRAGFIDVEALLELPLFAGAWREANDQSPRGTAPRLIIDRAVRLMMDAMVGDLVEQTRSRIATRGIASVADVRACAEQLVGPGPSMLVEKERLERWLFAHLYRHWQVNRRFHRARKLIADLFAFYCEHADALPPDHRARAERHGLHRAVADWIAGMTDRYATDEHRQLIGA